MAWSQISFLNCRNTLNIFSWAIDYFLGNIGFWTCFIKDDSQLLTAEALVDFSNMYTNGKGDKQDSFSGDADLEDNVTCSPAEERVERKLRLGRRPSRSAARQLLKSAIIGARYFSERLLVLSLRGCSDFMYNVQLSRDRSVSSTLVSQVHFDEFSHCQSQWHWYLYAATTEISFSKHHSSNWNIPEGRICSGKLVSESLFHLE